MELKPYTLELKKPLPNNSFNQKPYLKKGYYLALAAKTEKSLIGEVPFLKHFNFGTLADIKMSFEELLTNAHLAHSNKPGPCTIEDLLKLNPGI